MDGTKNSQRPSGQQRPPLGQNTKVPYTGQQRTPPPRQYAAGQQPPRQQVPPRQQMPPRQTGLYMGQQSRQTMHSAYSNKGQTTQNAYANTSQRAGSQGQTQGEGQRQPIRQPVGQQQYTGNRTQRTQQSKKRRKRKKKKGIIRRIFKFIFIVGIILCFAIGGAGLGVVMGIIEGTDAINVADVVPESYTSFIYDSQGNEIDNLHGDENREYAKLETIPVSLRHAVIAIEDERFYEHNGIDIRGIFRALVVNIENRNFSQGASTITQQLIKNEVLTNDKKIQRKIKEQYLAIIFERDLQKQLGSKQQAKDYILELYLNSIALNHGLNGVQAASKFYFGKEVSDLTLAESACIAGITQNPSLYSPITHPEENKERQLTVLTKMLELGYITQSEYDQAAAEDIYSKLVGSKTEEVVGEAKHNYFVDALIVQVAEDLMSERGMTKAQAYDMIYSGGLKINATIDMNMQAIMEEVYKNDDFFPSTGNTLEATYTISVMDNETEKQTHYYETRTVNSQEEAEAFAAEMKAQYEDSAHTTVADKLTVASSLQSSMVIMDYHNGEIKALVGGRGEKQGDTVFNRATQALRQPGSCFKPLAAYAPAIDMGLLMPGSIIIDEPLKVGSKQFQNWNKSYKGPTTVREGIRESMNILAVKTIMQVGYDKSFEYLQNFGFTTLVDNETRNGQTFTDKGPATALGGITDGVSVLELTGAYSTIANGGLYNKPKFYTTIYDHDGNVLLENKDEPTRVLKETTAYLLTDMMVDVVTGRGGYATGTAANFSGMSIAGKTGTTTDDKDLTFVGYTPYYCAGIWLGYDTPKVIPGGGTTHLKIWKEIMSRVHEGLADTGFSRPSGIVSRSFCSVSGMVPTGLCSGDYYGNAIGSDLSASDFGSSTEACTYHKSYSVDLTTGKLANEYCEATNVILAVNPDTGEIVNKSSEKVDIDIHSTCTEHSATNPGYVPEQEVDSEIPIGGEYPEEEIEGSETQPTVPPIENENPNTVPDTVVPPGIGDGSGNAQLQTPPDTITDTAADMTVPIGAQ